MISAAVTDEDKLPTAVPAELIEWAQSLRGYVHALKNENANLKEKVQQLTQTVGELRDEIAVLKGQKKRPVFKPSGMDKESETENDAHSKNGHTKARDGTGKSDKVAKTARLKIHEEHKIKVADVPQGSRFLGYGEFTVQELDISAHNTRFHLERWSTPDGRVLTASCPPEFGGQHFGPKLRAFILYQHHHCHVTQPKLHEQLLEWGLDISTGQINALLTVRNEVFANEKSTVLATGLQISNAITVDDTGARHAGKNGYVTVISSPEFAWFGSADNKSRIGFLTHLHDGKPSYAINEAALEYMREQGLKHDIMACVQTFAFEAGHWNNYLDWMGIQSLRHRAIVTEAALLGGLSLKDINPELVIVSDGARQFDILVHALCWIHTERLVHKLIAPNDIWRAQQEQVRAQIWDYYSELKAFRKAPSQEMAAMLDAKFDAIFGQRTGWITLNLLLERTFKNKQDLLRVLQRPQIPLHTNASETDIRDHVKMKKISGGTRSDLGRSSRDIFASLKKTCRKLGVSFWAYLNDRITSAGQILPLPELMRQRSHMRKLATTF